MALKVGFVGTGGIAQRHLEATAARDDIEMVGYADIELAKARNAAETYGGSAYEDFHDLYDEHEPDAVVICTPPFAHGEIEKEAAARGIHFFVEKPVAINMDIAADVLKSVSEAKIATQVGYMFRFSRPILRVRELLADRDIAMVQAHYYMPGLPPPTWWPYIEKGGGQLIEQATHMLDLGRFLAGEVATVTAATARVRNWTDAPDDYEPKRMREYTPEMTIPDTTGLLMEYEAGSLGTLSCSLVPQGEWDSGFKICADGLLVTIDGANARWVGDEESETEAEEHWQRLVLYELYDAAIAGETKTSVPYSEGVHSLAISLAGYESVDRGGVAVPVSEMLP